MECFSDLWVRHFQESLFNQPINKTHIENLSMDDAHTNQSIDLRDIIKIKAEKHHKYYKNLATDDCSVVEDTSIHLKEDSSTLVHEQNTIKDLDINETNREVVDRDDKEKMYLHTKNCTYATIAKRKRRTGVVSHQNSKGQHFDDDTSSTTFQSVKALRENYIALWNKSVNEFPNIINTNSKLLPLNSKELLQPPSGYSSSTTISDDECSTKINSTTVQRCGSSDSAMGQSEDDEYESVSSKPQVISSHLSRGSVDHENVPCRTLIEAHYVPLLIDRKLSNASDLCEFDGGNVDSRRQSFVTDDDAGEVPRYRYWRTPSVVVSDYSDDIIGGLTLEDIEYIRNQQAKHKEISSSPESSLHSSCSNLQWCGSTISSLESDYVLKKPFRKLSNCSTCSTLSEDEDDVALLPVSTKTTSGWRKLRNIVHWTPFFQTYKKHRYPWVQLAGHQGNFKAGPDQGTILKKLCAKEEKCFKVLMKDVLRPYVPEYKGLVSSEDGECSYIQLQDLLGDFVSPCVMDCKIGVRTYLEEELAKAKEKPKLRKDMYDKMCQIDSNAPTDEEHKLKGVTKPRYMVWRETISSTSTLGFRIEGIRKADGTSSKDFKTTKTREQIINAFADFVIKFPHALPKYIQRLKAIKATLETSMFFSNHEVIGSSLLFVHDQYNANVWLIDFAKTIKLPDDVNVTHYSKWKVGTHEDGYLIGVNNIITIFKHMMEQQPITITPPLTLKDQPGIKYEEEEEGKT